MTEKNSDTLPVSSPSVTDQAVCAVLVTYNRKGLLIETITGLLIQSAALKKILLVDNQSSDGTAEILQEKGWLDSLPPTSLDENFHARKKLDNGMEFHYIRSCRNIGGAGGFSLGLKTAFEDRARYDHFWLMDDDVEPDETALEYQLGFTDLSCCITPSKRALDGEILEWYGWLDLKTLREKPIPSDHFQGDLAFVNMTCFEGMLVSRELVAKIGYPDARFFIYGDDVVYGYQASQFTRPIYLTRPTFVKKLKKKNFKKRYGSYFPFASMNLAYFLMRNYLLKAKMIKRATPSKINMSRVYLYHVYYLIKQVTKAILIERSLKKIGRLLKGFRDSFSIANHDEVN